MVKKSDKLYLNKSLDRRKQIADWVVESATLEGKGFLIREIGTLLESPLEKERFKGVKLFESLVFNLREDTLLYLIKANIRAFGKGRIFGDLFQNIYGRSPRVRKITKAFRGTTKTDLKDIKQQIKQTKTRKVVFGFTAEGKRRKVFQIVFIRQPKTHISYIRKDGRKIMFDRKEYSYTIFRGKGNIALRKKKQ